MTDKLTIENYRDILSDKLRLIRELEIALTGCGFDDAESSLSQMIDFAKELRTVAFHRGEEIERLRKALQTVSVAHIEPETEFSNTIKKFSRAMLAKLPSDGCEFPIN